MTPATDTPAPSPVVLAEQLLVALRAEAVPANLAGMARYGIVIDDALGVSMPVVRRLAADAKRTLKRSLRARHELAALLWESCVHEARIMASLVYTAALVDDAQLEAWLRELDSWDTCDTLMNNLVRRAPLAWSKAHEWPERDEEFVRRAGFVLGASAG